MDKNKTERYKQDPYGPYDVNPGNEHKFNIDRKFLGEIAVKFGLAEEEAQEHEQG